MSSTQAILKGKMNETIKLFVLSRPSVVPGIFLNPEKEIETCFCFCLVSTICLLWHSFVKESS
jgi:hypothetical protein